MRPCPHASFYAHFFQIVQFILAAGSGSCYMLVWPKLFMLNPARRALGYDEFCRGTAAASMVCRRANLRHILSVAVILGLPCPTRTAVCDSNWQKAESSSSVHIVGLLISNFSANILNMANALEGFDKKSSH